MRLGFDYAEQFEGEDVRPAQKGFELLSCGFDLHVRFLDVDAFPSLERRIRKRGAKLVRRNLLWMSAVSASFVSQAIPTLIIEMQDAARPQQQAGQRGDESHERWLALRSLIADYFRLPKETKELMAPCAAEFEVMRTHEPREEVAEGRAAANAYSSALLRGENPDEDPELVKEQQRYARDYFINQAALADVKISLDWTTQRISTYPRVAGRLVDIGTADGDKVRAYRSRALAALLEGLRPYQERAQIDGQFLREIGLDSRDSGV